MSYSLERRLWFQLPTAGLSWMVATAALAPFPSWAPAVCIAVGFVLAHAVSYELFQADRLETDPPGFQDALSFALAAAGGSALATVAVVALRQAPAWHALLLEAVLHMTLLLGWLGWRRLGSFRAASPFAKRALFLMNPDSRATAAVLRGLSTRSVDPVGWLDERRERLGATVDGLPILGAVEELPYLIDWHRIDVVVALTFPHEADLASRLREQAEVADVELIFLPRLSAAFSAESSRTRPRPVSSAA